MHYLSRRWRRDTYIERVIDEIIRDACNHVQTCEDVLHVVMHVRLYAQCQQPSRQEYEGPGDTEERPIKSQISQKK